MNITFPAAVFMTAGLLVVAGCGKKPAPAVVVTPAAGSGPGATVSNSKDWPLVPVPVVKKAWDPALGTGTIHGVVKVKGTAPARPAIFMATTPACASLHTAPVLDDSLIVNAGGALENAVVWVKDGLEGWNFPVPASTVLLDQKGCVYSPHIAVVQVGQKLAIRNSDGVSHNVNMHHRSNDSANPIQLSGTPDIVRTLLLPEEPVLYSCNMHGWMASYVGVVENPFFAVTDNKGTFDLKGVPPGPFTLKVWHEKLGRQQVKVDVKDGETVPVEITFEIK